MGASEIRVAAGIFVGLVVLILLARRILRRSPDTSPAKKILEGQSLWGARLLAVPLALATLMGLLAAWMLTFVAFTCFFYTLALAHGEVAGLMGVLPFTAGNILFHATFPAQIFFMGLFILLLVLGAFQIVIGPLPAGKLLFLRVEDIPVLVGRLAGLLALVAALELCRTVVAGAILPPGDIGEFFAQGAQTPLTDPTGLALLSAGTVLGAVLLILAMRRKP